MKRMVLIGLLTASSMLTARVARATPTTNIWNPSTDIQAPGTVHLGFDNYFSVQDNAKRPLAFPTDVGLTYGLGSGFEVGVDLFEPSPKPVVFNAKWGLSEKETVPAFAVGIQGVGTSKSTQSNILYGLAAKSFGEIGRFTAGGYSGSKSVLGSDRSGAILAWDRSFGKKWWASVDYASGNNAYGALAIGGSYKFAANASVIAGYVFFNDSMVNPNDTLTTQIDFDF